MSISRRRCSVDLPLDFLVWPVIIAGLVVLLVLALAWQRQGLSTQQRNMSQVEESLKLARHTLRLQEEANALAREGVQYQREALDLLRRLTEQEATRGGAAPLATVGSIRPSSARLDG
jgi:hypothetical protein